MQSSQLAFGYFHSFHSYIKCSLFLLVSCCSLLCVWPYCQGEPSTYSMLLYCISAGELCSTDA